MEVRHIKEGNSLKMIRKDDGHDTIKVCWNCWGKEPCLCSEKQYKAMWDFVYEAIKRLNPM